MGNARQPLYSALRWTVKNCSFVTDWSVSPYPYISSSCCVCFSKLNTTAGRVHGQWNRNMDSKQFPPRTKTNIASILWAMYSQKRSFKPLRVCTAQTAGSMPMIWQWIDAVSWWILHIVTVTHSKYLCECEAARPSQTPWLLMCFFGRHTDM